MKILAGDIAAEVKGEIRPSFSSKREDAPAHWGQGILWIRHATSATTDGAYSLIEQLCPKGSGPGPHVHLTSTETMYVLEGQVTFLAGTEQTTLGPGGLISLPPGTVHAFRIDSPTARLLNTYVPPSWEEAIIATSEPALARTLPPPDRPRPASAPDFLKLGMRVVDMPDPLRP